MNNTPAHLVARALRDRRTITYQYDTSPHRFQYRNTPRAQILADVRRSSHHYIFGTTAHDLHTFTINPEPPAPAAPPYDAAAARVDLRRLIIISQLDNAATADELDALVTAVRLRAATVLQILTQSPNQTA